MVPTMILPAGTRVLDVSDRIRHALDELELLEPNRYALAHWVTTNYRSTLVVGGREHWPLMLRMSTDVATAVAETKKALARAREAARSLDGAFVESLPPRVHVVRVKDQWSAMGFAPIDVRGAPLAARALSLLLADYLMRPEAYVDNPRAA